jgi:hypothetical protein
LESSGRIPPVDSAFDSLWPFGHCQRAQRNPEAWRPLHPGSGYAPDRLVKAGFPARLYFEFHHFPFRFQPPPAGRLFYNQPLAVALRVSGLVK